MREFSEDAQTERKFTLEAYREPRKILRERVEEVYRAIDRAELLVTIWSRYAKNRLVYGTRWGAWRPRDS